MAKRKKIKKYQPGGYYNPYDELTMPSDSFSGINNAQALENERLNTLSQMSFQELNPGAFNSATIRATRPEEEGGFRTNLAKATSLMQRGGAPTDFLSEFTFIPTLSRIFGDPDRGQYGAGRQVYETIKEDPFSVFKGETFLPLLDFIPAAGGLGYLGKNAARFRQPFLATPQNVLGNVSDASRLISQRTGNLPVNTSNIQFTSSPMFKYDDILSQAKSGNLAPETVSNFLKELARGNPTLNRGIQQSVNELSTARGFDRLVDMYEDTNRYYYSNPNPSWAAGTAQELAKQRIEDLKNVKTYNQLAEDYISSNFMGPRTNVEAFLNSDFMRPQLMGNAGYFPPGKSSIIPEGLPSSIDYKEGMLREDLIGLGTNYADDMGTVRHEVSHFKQKYHPSEDPRPLAMDIRLQENLKPRKNLTKAEQASYDYFLKGSSGKEPVPFMEELRNTLVETGHMKYADDGYYADVTPDQLRDAYIELTKNPAYRYVDHPGTLQMTKDGISPVASLTSNQRIFDFIDPTPEQFKYLASEMNKLSVAIPAVAAGVEATNKKNGGKIMKYNIGGVVKNNADAEIEGGELILTQQGAPQLDNMSMLKFLGPNAFEVKGKSHAQGGIFAKFSEGESIVISRKYAKEMKKVLADKNKASEMLNSGDPIDQNQAKIDLANIEARQNEIIDIQQSNNGNQTNVTMGKKGLWANIHAKRRRIAAGSGEKMRRPGSKGAPTDEALKQSQARYGLRNMSYQEGGKNISNRVMQDMGMPFPLTPDLYGLMRALGYPEAERPDISFQSDATNVASPLLDEVYMQQMLDDQPGLEAPFDANKILNPASGTYLYETRDQGSGQSQQVRDHEFLLDAYRSEIDRMERNFAETPMKNADYMENVAPGAAGGTKKERDAERNFNNFLRSYMDMGMDTLNYKHGAMHTNPPMIPMPSNASVYQTPELTGQYSNLDRSVSMPYRTIGDNYLYHKTYPMGNQYNRNREPGKRFAYYSKMEMKDGGRVMGGQPPKYFLGGILGGIGSAIKGAGGLGGILGAVAPYASGIYNVLAPMIAGKPDTYDPQDFMVNPSQVTDRVAPISQSVKRNRAAQVDPYAQTAPMMQLAATAMNNYSGPNSASYRQALLSDMQGKVGSQFAQADYMNQLAQERLEAFNFGVDKANVGVDMANADISKYNAGLAQQANMQNAQTDWTVNQYNDQLLAAGPAQTATGIGQLSNAFMGQQYNQTLQDLSNTFNYSMGNYMG